MDFSFGKYKGKAVAWILLSKPDYFLWMKSKGMNNKAEYKFMLKLLETLNSKSFNGVKCIGRCNGSNPVTRLSLYNGQYNGEYWFCDKCDPYSSGALPGKLTTIRKYSEIIGSRYSELLIKSYCIAKSVPKRKTKAALKSYFNY
jgi:uncharacterized protein (DUF3820 family)